jgi:hypothetical protein
VTKTAATYADIRARLCDDTPASGLRA